MAPPFSSTASTNSVQQRTSTTAHAVVAVLEKYGVRWVFGVPGEETLALVEALRTSRIEFVPTRHEQHAAFMAATIGRLTGNPGVCLSTLGPGATNLVTGLAHAKLGGYPLLALTGQKAVQGNRQGGFQLLDIGSILRPVTKWSRSVLDPADAPAVVRHAFSKATEGRPGPVHIELPTDIARAEYKRALPPTPDAPPSRAESDQIARVADRIARARRPILIISGGAQRPGVPAALRRLVTSGRLYAVATQLGKGALPDDHPRSMGSLGIHAEDYPHLALEDADLVITVGYHVAEYPPSVWNPERNKQIIHIGTDRGGEDPWYTPDQEVIGDVRWALDALAERLPANPDEAHGTAGLRQRIFDSLYCQDCAPSYPPTPRSIVRAVRELLEDRDVVSLDNGIYKIWFARLYECRRPNGLLLDNALATMGAGLAMAMASKMVQPKRKHVAVVGDGGLMMNVQDLETAVRLDLDLVVLVLTDGGYGFIRWKQQTEDFPEHGVEFGNPDFVALAESLGARGLRVKRHDELRTTLKTALTNPGVHVIECPIDYTANEELTQLLEHEPETP